MVEDDYSVLAIAYHNIAVERDFLHQWDEAPQEWSVAMEIIVTSGSDFDPHATPELLSKDFRLQPGLEWKFLLELRHCWPGTSA